MSDSPRKQCLIIGAGAIGTVLAHYLQAGRHGVRFYIRQVDLADYQANASLRLERAAKAPLISKAPPLTTAFHLDDVDYIFICVKHPNLNEVIAALPRDLPEGIGLVSCLNGVGIARRLRSEFPMAEVSTMTIMFNAQLIAPMHAQITTRPVVYVDSEDKGLGKLFRGTDVQIHQAQGESAAWGKLVLNLSNSVCALTNTTFRDLLCNKDLTRLFSAVMDEAIAVLDHAAIRYNLTAPIPYVMYRWLLLNAGPLPWWTARMRNGLTENSYPSMVADMRLGRPTEIEQLNGEVVRLGDQVGVETPINSRLVELIHAREGRPLQDFMTPDELAEELGLAG